MATNREPQPIETAPKRQEALLWREGRGWLIADWANYYKYNGPTFTHWLPLPDPPANSAAQAKINQQLMEQGRKQTDNGNSETTSISR